jgi:hypothetical protein
MGSSPGRALAPAPAMVSKRDSQRHPGKREQSEARRQTRTVRGTPANVRRPQPQMRRRAPLPQHAAECRERRGMSRTPRDVANAAECRRRREPWPADLPRGRSRSRSGSGVGAGCLRNAARRGHVAWRIPQVPRRRPHGTPRMPCQTVRSGLRAPGRAGTAASRARDPGQRIAQRILTPAGREPSVDAPGAGPHKRAAGRLPNPPGAGLRGFRAR